MVAATAVATGVALSPGSDVADAVVLRLFDGEGVVTTRLTAPELTV